MSTERQIENLERELEREDLSYDDRRDIERELREMERELAERERWEQEGYQNGWR